MGPMAYLCAMEHPLPETTVTSPPEKWMVGSYETRFLFGAFRPIFRGPNVRFREVGQPTANPPNLSTWRRRLMWMISLIPAAGWKGSEIDSFFGVAPNIHENFCMETFHLWFSNMIPKIFSMGFFGSIYWTVQIPFGRFISPLANLNKKHVEYLPYRCSGDHPEDGHGVGRGPLQPVDMENIPFSIGFHTQEVLQDFWWWFRNPTQKITSRFEKLPLSTG